MKRIAVILAATVTALIVLAAIGWMALPWGLETWGPGVIESRLGVAPLRYRVAEVHPSRLVLHDVSIGEKGSALTAASLVVTYDILAQRVHTVTLDRPRIDAAWQEGGLHVQGIGPLAAFLTEDTAPDDAPPARIALPMDTLRINAAQVTLRLPDLFAEIVVDAVAEQTSDGLTAESSISATASGLAAEASFVLVGPPGDTTNWRDLSAQGRVDITARDASLPALADGVDGFASATVSLDQGSFHLLSEDGIVLTAREIEDHLLAALPGTLQAQSGAGATLVAGGAHDEPLHVVVTPEDDGSTAIFGSVSASARMGQSTGRLSVDGHMVVDRGGRFAEAALPSLEVVVNALPVQDGLVHASLHGRNVTARPDALSMDADLYTLAERLRIGGTMLPRLRVLVSGPMDWRDAMARMALRDGRLTADGPLSLGGVEVPGGVDWALRPTADGSDALVLDLGNDAGPVLRTRLGVPDPTAVVRTAGRTVDARFVAAEIDALLPLTAPEARQVTVDLTEGTLHSDDLAASDVYATVVEGPQGLTVEAEAQVPHLPGEALPLPAATEEHRPLRLRGTVEHSRNGDPLRFQAQVREGGLKTVLRLTGEHSLENGRGRADVTVPRLTFGDDLQPENLFAPLAEAALRLEGDAAAQGTLSWTPKGMAPRLEVLLDDMALRRGFVALQHIHGVIEVTSLWPLGTPPGQAVAVGIIDAGVPLTNAEVTFQLDREHASIEGARMTMAEGRITADPFVLPFDGSGATTVLRAADLRLDQLVALADLGGLSATGRLDGEVPVELREGNILFHGGELRADRPGTIRYRPDEPPAALAAGGGGVDLMLQALSDFRYETLRLTINGSAAGDLVVGLHIGGNNPDLYGGYPLEFNLTLSGALAQVIEGSLTGYQVPDRIRKHMERFGIEP